MAKTYSSLEGFLSFSKLTTISYQALSYIQPFKGILFPVHNILDDYIDEFKEKAIAVEFSDAEYEKFKYKPRLLSNYLYDSTELFFVILALNGIATEKEFTSKTLYLLKNEDMKSLLETIYTNEKSFIEDYNSRLKKEYEEENEAE